MNPKKLCLISAIALASACVSPPLVNDFGREKLNQAKVAIYLGTGILPTNVCEVAFDFISRDWVAAQRTFAALQPVCGRVSKKSYADDAYRIRCLSHILMNEPTISELEAEAIVVASLADTAYEGWSAEKLYCSP